MKKIISLAIVALFTVSAQAQLKFGVKAGANITHMTLSEEVLNASNRAGFYVGPALKLKIPVIGIGFDIAALYDQREAELEIPATTGAQPAISTITTKHVSVPLNLRWQFGPDLLGVFVYAGPQLAFNVGDKSASIPDWDIKSSQLSANVGAGVMLLGHLQLNANYNLALGRTSEANVSEVLHTAFDTKSNAWQIGIAYWF